jgi:hypothetical protein
VHAVPAYRDSKHNGGCLALLAALHLVADYNSLIEVEIPIIGPRTGRAAFQHPDNLILIKGRLNPILSTAATPRFGTR